MLKFRFLSIILLIFSLTELYSLQQDDYYKINKSFDIYGEAYYRIMENYVIDIDPEILMKNGILGMLKSLDPYCDFYDELNIDEKDFFLQENYAGLGFTIASLENKITVTGLIDDAPAQEAGIRVGDMLYSIDSTVVLNFSVEELRKYTLGEPGTKATVKILRMGINDTLEFDVKRRSINLNSLTVKHVFPDSIAFIKLDKFSKNTVSEIKSALIEMKEKYKLRGLILDLRDNPGGLLDAAVRIAELFIPKESLIVTTKSRSEKNNYEYFSMSEPVFSDIPLVVLINENSASASEIVAGAIQDLDRGVVFGEKSYGKGLVQNVIDLPHSTALKLTTAKYFTPSGRCIQRIKFGEDYSKNSVSSSPDTTKYFTKNGRIVYESTGIMPDSLIDDKRSDFVSRVINSNAFFKFANLEASKYRSPKKDYQLSDEVFKQFIDFYTKNTEDTTFSEMYFLDAIEDISKSNNYNDRIKNLISELKKNIRDEYSTKKIYSNELIRKYLNIEIRSRFLKESETIKEYLELDEWSKQSRSLINSKSYNKIISNNN